MKRTLGDIQTDFQRYVLGQEGARSTLAGDIASQYGLDVESRLAIYYDAYRLRMGEALSETFDKTHAYVGDDMFAELSAGYLNAFPSANPNLRWYGDAFARYLVDALPVYPMVAELAAFEWALGLAFDAADAPVLTMAEVALIQADDWEHVGFYLQPSLQLVPMQWNVPAIWLALEQEQPVPEPVMSEKAQDWVVWRKDLQPHFRSLAQVEALALRGLQKGESFSGVCEAAAVSAGEHDITSQIAGWLQTWVSEAVLAGIRSGTSSE